MVLFVLAYLGGVLTIASPCILPVLPFVFARAGQPFLSSTLPMLGGMAVAFAAVATLAAVGGGWAVEANEYGRFAALALLAVFGAALLFPVLAERLTRPLVAAGAHLSRSADERSGAGRSSAGPSLLLGLATGLLWAPCAGPVLGLILTGAALGGASVQTSLLLAAYAVGAATSLALALLVGGRVYAAMKRSLAAGQWVRRAMGAAVLAAVLAISLGLDTGVLTSASLASTGALEQRLLDRFGDAKPAAETASAASGTGELPVEGIMPSLDGATEWLNSPPLTAAGLRGKVVLVDFWTYSCINCLRALPYVKAWADKYRDQGLVVIGVHAPEFAFEKNLGNVRRAVSDLKVDYPVAVDNGYAIWRAWGNKYWPAHYFVDAEGRIRHHRFSEGEYDGSEHVIQQLLAEAGHPVASSGLVSVAAAGSQAAPDMAEVKSPETYLGYQRAKGFASHEDIVPDAPHEYAAVEPELNDWTLAGTWTVGPEHAVLDQADGRIVFRFHARDLHLVLGPASDGGQVRFRVTVDGAAPGADHGSDVGADGTGIVDGQRLYQLVRQAGPVVDHTFEIQFLDPGVQAYAFTFG